MLTVENDGPRIASTNFFETDQAKAGKFFVSVYAGTLRLLIPDAHAAIIKETKTAEYVILSRGPWPAEEHTEGVELLWENHSASPFALHLTATSFDILPPEPEPGRHWYLTAWVNGPKQVGEWQCHWRRVPEIPWLKPLAADIP
jgi:hypothetical protein